MNAATHPFAASGRPDAPPRAKSVVHPAIADAYSTPEEVLAELAKRWANPELSKEIAAFLGGHVLPPLAERPRAILARNLATPDNEFNEFAAQSRALGLSPLLLEYSGDRFTTLNRGKMSLVKLAFHHGMDKNGAARVTHLRVVDDANACQKQPIKEMRTRWGEPLANFHRRLLRGFHATEVHDSTEWFRQAGDGARVFYPKLLASFSLRHVLFENFGPGREERFFHDVVRPSLEWVRQRFGLKPLLLPVAPADEMADVFWWSYPENVKPRAETPMRATAPPEPAPPVQHHAERAAPPSAV